MYPTCRGCCHRNKPKNREEDIECRHLPLAMWTNMSLSRRRRWWEIWTCKLRRKVAELWTHAALWPGEVGSKQRWSYSDTFLLHFQALLMLCVKIGWEEHIKKVACMLTRLHFGNKRDNATTLAVQANLEPDGSHSLCAWFGSVKGAPWWFFNWKNDSTTDSKGGRVRLDGIYTTRCCCECHRFQHWSGWMRWMVTVLCVTTTTTTT